MIFAKKKPVAHAKRAPPSHAGEDLLHPPYAIDNAAGSLSDRTASVSPFLSLIIRAFVY